MRIHTSRVDNIYTNLTILQDGNGKQAIALRRRVHCTNVRWRSKSSRLSKNHEHKLSRNTAESSHFFKWPWTHCDTTLRRNRRLMRMSMQLEDVKLDVTKIPCCASFGKVCNILRHFAFFKSDWPHSDEISAVKSYMARIYRRFLGPFSSKIVGRNQRFVRSPIFKKSRTQANWSS